MSGLTNVKILSLRNNALSILPDISFMKVLETLILHRNRLASMPDLYELPLTTLTLNENPLICDKALCWIRMWPWMRNSTIPSDKPTCAGPVPIAGIKVMDVDPTLMECFGGEFVHSTQLQSWASSQIRKISGCPCAGNAGNVSPTTDFKVRHARALMHVGIANPRGGREKCSRYSRRMHNPLFYVSGKRPMGDIYPAANQYHFCEETCIAETIYLHFQFFLEIEMAKWANTSPTGKNLFIRHKQNHGRWWPP